MAATAPQKLTSDHFSISGLISRFRSKHRHSPAPTQDPRPPLIASPLPLVLTEHQHVLSKLGWTTVTFPQPSLQEHGPKEHILGRHPLQSAYEELFQASQKFFDLPDSEKEQWKNAKLGSEEGWSKIPGEKEFITLRTLEGTPNVLKEAAQKYWNAAGSYLDSSLGKISTSLGIPSDSPDTGLRKFIGPCKHFQCKDEDKTATMLRLFRYEGWEAKVVAEPHTDLGLLSLVVGNVPGLEVWNGKRFIGVEKEYKTPCATLLGGRQLQQLSNGRVEAGGHRVVSYGKPVRLMLSSAGEAGEQAPKYRFSIVFVLRAHEPVVVNSSELETKITGKWAVPIRDVTAGEMYDEIKSAHFNINIGVQEREAQRRKLDEKKRGNGSGDNDK
ncbi:hypothetical protein P154DRAFT_552105 [Amniculicola lignicola CBS 123094]|uniref:Clavaminate synthase-like protein n=1 Tax=Amniculicola lignicola CBS 123094 TaxID=1392246 RepID=A0A6A5WYQ1_9PLEO|nr:hypothetical protein P154DRAFT_552105 [Amniculicola lignicola CBS 123094]